MKYLVILLLFVAVMGIVGNGDLQEAERAETEYCENVDSGAWPDYRGNASEVCQ